jgi:hypothetical protein
MQYDSAWIGGGSGNCPMTARKLFAPLLRRIDVVELSAEVMGVVRLRTLVHLCVRPRCFLWRAHFVPWRTKKISVGVSPVFVFFVGAAGWTGLD